MSRAALLDAPLVAPRDEPAPRTGQLDEAGRSRSVERRPPGGERPTLGQLVTSAWEGLLAAGHADCPVCGGRMELHHAEGRCNGCQATLS